jgi:hypothetical protein
VNDHPAAGPTLDDPELGVVVERHTTPGRQLAVAVAGTALVLIAFTVPLATLSATASGLHAGPGPRPGSSVR